MRYLRRVTLIWAAVLTTIALLCAACGSNAVSAPTAHSNLASKAPYISLTAAPARWHFSEQTLQQGHYARYYLLAQPDHLTQHHLPLVVVLHGRQMTPDQMEALSHLPEVVGQAVLVYPAGVDRSWNAGFCCGAAHVLGVNDVSFIESVISHVLNSVAGTSAQDVYLLGYSNGGRMAYRMACADPGAFAAVAAVEAVPVYSCPKERPVPFMEVASTGDPLLTIPDNLAPKHIAGHTEMTVDEAVAQRRAADACTRAASQTVIGAVTVTEWASCSAASRVELAEYHGGSHHWPEGNIDTPSAEHLIWAFFQDHQPIRPTVVR